jgi:hypothetical protein
MCGFGSGFVLMRQYCPFSASGLWWQRVLRTMIGLAGLLVLYFGFSLLAPEKGTVSDLVYYFVRFLRYGILGFWISFGAPWFFNLFAPIRQPEPQLASG